MEKIKVNMSPNPLDVQTIHASQNDGEARQWEFELHNNGELIDTSDVKEQLVFKAYKGGTEQLLPENGSTPTTSPFLGDIRYPQGLLTDQEFSYRQSPTEEDGLAKITDIKGNTLNWNQLAGTLVSTQEQSGVTFTNNGDGSITLNGTSNNTSTTHPVFVANDIEWKADHRYYIELNNASLPPLLVRTITGSTGAFEFARRNTDDSKRYLINGANIGSPLGDEIGHLRFRWAGNIGLTFNNDKIIPQIFDLTQMFGAEKAEEIYQMEVNEVGSGVDYFRSLFPLSYYAYNQGSLISFNGNGIKTVGKNLFDGIVKYANSNISDSGVISGGQANYDLYAFKLFSGSYTLTYTEAYTSVSTTSRVVGFADSNYSNGTLLGNSVGTASSRSISFTITDKPYVLVQLRKSATNIQLEKGSATSYEPYTESVLSLPISTYFPTGMDGVGSDYDELTNTKATTRMARVDLGSLNWAYASGVQRFYALNFANVKTNAENVLANICCALYENSIWSQVQGDATKDKVISVANKNILIRDKTYTDPTAFKNSLNGVYLVFPLATPTETSFTTASLVTENAEIPLSNNDGVLIGKCTEQLSENPGFFDAKIKLADDDGECYSNKIQLHVERSPQ